MHTRAARAGAGYFSQMGVVLSALMTRASRAGATFPCRMRPGPAIAKDFLHARA